VFDLILIFHEFPDEQELIPTEECAATDTSTLAQRCPVLGNPIRVV
jgi:hypothetical protein